MLGAPPAFVLSQDQTLYKWYLSLKSVKSLFAQHAIACVLCELLCLELFNVFFQHENRFRYKFFDIVQFSRSCSASALRLTTWLFYHRSDFLSSSFSKFFVIQISLANLERSRFLGAGRNFRTSIGSFRFTSSWDSEVILLSQRLALKYNTIRRGGCQHFFCKFFQVFSRRLKSASASYIFRVRRPDAVDKNKNPNRCFLLICGVSRDIIAWTVPTTKKGITILENKVKVIP